MESFGKNLKRLRMNKGLTLRQLAEAVNSNYAYLSQLEADIAKPGEDLVKRIAKYFGEDEERLLFVARGIPAQIQEIKDKFPNISPSYFRKAAKRGDK